MQIVSELAQLPSEAEQEGASFRSCLVLVGDQTTAASLLNVERRSGLVVGRCGEGPPLSPARAFQRAGSIETLLRPEA